MREAVKQPAADAAISVIGLRSVRGRGWRPGDPLWAVRLDPDAGHPAANPSRRGAVRTFAGRAGKGHRWLGWSGSVPGMSAATSSGTVRRVDWSDGEWLNPPVRALPLGDGELLVTAAAETDFWRHTSYGFVHDDGHALLAPLAAGTAMEVSFVADYDQQFDQAGLLVRVDAENWVKTGVEYCDGAAQLGAVVTRGVSDWSSGPVPEWAGRTVTRPGEPGAATR